MCRNNSHATSEVHPQHQSAFHCIVDALVKLCHGKEGGSLLHLSSLQIHVCSLEFKAFLHRKKSTELLKSNTKVLKKGFGEHSHFPSKIDTHNSLCQNALDN